MRASRAFKIEMFKEIPRRVFETRKMFFLERSQNILGKNFSAQPP